MVMGKQSVILFSLKILFFERFGLFGRERAHEQAREPERGAEGEETSGGLRLSTETTWGWVRHPEPATCVETQSPLLNC